MTVRVLIGYDGSPEAVAAIDAGGVLFPGAHGWITYLWLPPFASDSVRRRLRPRARNINELIAMVEQEGEREARKLVATGVTLAEAAGWEAEALLKRTWGGEGWRIAQCAEEVDANLVLVGSRGLGGTEAALGSVSDLVVHDCGRPVVVVPHPLLSAEYAALSAGPVVVGWDGSTGAETALATASSLFSERDLLLVWTDDDTAPAPAADGSKGQRIVRVEAGRGHGLPAKAISDALIATAREHNAALIVVGSRGRSAVREIVLGSVAMATVHHAERPVMVVPNEWKAPEALG